MSRHQKNQLLARLDAKTFATMGKSLSFVSLEQGVVINKPHSPVEKVYFPHSGIISCAVELVDGAIATGMIGNDGQYGAGPALDHKLSLNLVKVQRFGSASVIEADRLREIVQDNPRLREEMSAYEQFCLAQAQQTGACNAVHKVEARICKWLLRMRKLVGDDLPLTQDLLAKMIGVRRPSVTEVAVHLQQAGMITYGRGWIRITDVARIQARACECDARINSHYSKIFGQDGAPDTI